MIASLVTERARERLVMAAVVLAAFLAMAPSLGCGFTNFDDNLYLTQNPKVFGLSLAHLAQMFTTHHEGQYGPLVPLSFALQYHFWGLDPFPYHALNLLLHLINTALAFKLSLRLSNDRMTAFLTALLFAVHPVHVEPVVWISSRKDMLYSFFYLSSILAYLKNSRTGVRGAKPWPFLFFGLSLLSKPVAVTLPAVLWLIEKYHFGRSPGLARRLTPYFALSFIFGVIALVSHPSSRMGSWNPEDFLQRFVAVFYALYLYLSKLVCPVNLSGLYPWPVVHWKTALFQYGSYISSILAIFAASALLAIRSKIFRFGALFFLIVIFPALPFLKYSIAVAADKYVYLASFGLFFILAAGFSSFRRSGFAAGPAKSFVWSIVLIIIFFILAGASQRRCSDWKNSVTFWDNVLAQYPSSAFALERRADHFNESGEYARALGDYNRVLVLRRKSPYAYNNRGTVYLKTGKVEKAIADFSRAVLLDPGDAKAYNNRGVAYASLGRFQEAEADFEAAIRTDPSSADFRNNRRAAAGQKALSRRPG